MVYNNACLSICPQLVLSKYSSQCSLPSPPSASLLTPSPAEPLFPPRFTSQPIPHNLRQRRSCIFQTLSTSPHTLLHAATIMDSIVVGSRTSKSSSTPSTPSTSTTSCVSTKEGEGNRTPTDCHLVSV